MAARSGWLSFLRALYRFGLQDFMLQAGDPTGTGRGGESIYGKNFEVMFGRAHEFKNCWPSQAPTQTRAFKGGQCQRACIQMQVLTLTHAPLQDEIHPELKHTGAQVSHTGVVTVSSVWPRSMHLHSACV